MGGTPIEFISLYMGYFKEWNTTMQDAWVCRKLSYAAKPKDSLKASSTAASVTESWKHT